MTLTRYLRRASGAVLIFIFIACVASTAARAAQEPEEQFTATMAGVRLEVTADVWSGVPPHLGEVVPLLVTITNNSDIPLRLRYDQFAIVGPAGDRFQALPPFAIEGTEHVSIRGYTPGPYPFAASRFWVAPHVSRFYPTLSPFAGPFAYDSWYYSTYYPSFARVDLPTADMIVKALPEGVLDPGGRLQGFLYMRDEPEDGEQSTFVAELVNARTGEPFGRIEAPIEID